MRRRRKGKNKKSMPEMKSMIGAIIDLPLDQFREELVKQKVNIGTVNNVILNMSSAYNELKMRKDAVLDLVFKGVREKDDPEVQNALNGLYAEMTKIEQKIEVLKERASELINVDKTPN